MATWVNLLDIIYPAGSLYFSRSSTSPASIVGGSWTQIKGAVIAATGANSFTTNNYGGSLKISVNQMPSHNHSLINCPPWYTTNWRAGNNIFAQNNTTAGYANYLGDSADYKVSFQGGAKLFALPLRSIHLVQNCLVSSPLWEVI